MDSRLENRHHKAPALIQVYEVKEITSLFDVMTFPIFLQLVDNRCRENRRHKALALIQVYKRLKKCYIIIIWCHGISHLSAASGSLLSKKL